MRLKHLICGGASALVLTSIGGGVAFAQEQEQVTNVSGLVVTVQKREQQLQNVPAAVTVANQEVLEDAGVRDIKDLTVLTPGLLVTSTSNETSTTARIRGIGTVGDNPGLESSVSVVIDGVYRPRNGVGFGDLGELQRIEVLKGPQGTLFGKNTSAGVINVITQEPRFTFRAITEVTGGNYDNFAASQTVTGPIIEDVLAGRFYIGFNQRDGFLDVSTPTSGAPWVTRTDTEDVTSDYYTARGQLLWFPNESWTLKFIGDYTERDELCCLGVPVVLGALNPAVRGITAGEGMPDTANPFNRVAYANRETNQEIEDAGLSMEANWDMMALGGARLTSISAVRKWETVNLQDSDFTGADILYRPRGAFGRQFDQFSQEVRLNGESMDGRLNWLVGAFYADEELHSDEGLRNGDQLESYLNVILAAAGGMQTFTGVPNGLNIPSGTGFQDTYDQQSTTWAIFTNNSYQLTDRMEFTFGLRYTEEKKDLHAQYSNIGGATACQNLLNRESLNATIFGGAPGNPAVANAGRASTGYRILYGFVCAPGGTPAFNSTTTAQSRREDELSGTVKLAYDFTDDMMGYFSYSRGYKAGGFNLDRARFGSTVTGFTVNPDTSFPEENVDSFELGLRTTWNDNLLLNGTVFYQKYEGFQLNTFTGISFIVASIPSVTSQGVDIDFMWFSPIDGLNLQGGVVYADTQYGNFTPGPGISALLPGNRVSFAPLWAVSGSASYERPVSDDLTFRGSLNARWTSEYNTGSDLNPLKVQRPFTLVNARMGLSSMRYGFDAELWAQNLFDEDYIQVAFDATFQTGTINAFLGAPGQYGVTLRKRFGE